MMAGDDLGTGSEAAVDWFRTKTLLGAQIRTNGTSSTGAYATYIKGVLGEIPGLALLEVRNGIDLSGLTNVRVEIIGE